MTRLLVHSDQPQQACGIISARYPDIEIETCTDYPGLAAAVARFEPDVVFTSRFDPGTFPRDALIGASSVRWISNAGSGCNHLVPWDPGTQTVTNSAGVAAEAMANFAIGAMLHFAMDVPGLIADQKARDWTYREVAPLDDKTLLLIGAGKTALATARIAKAMKMRVEAVRARHRPAPDLDAVHGPDGLTTAIARADYILVCLPLTDLSRGMIGQTALAAVKPGAILIDLSRGGIVDHDALIPALDSGRLGGAALDVFPTEPLPAESPLWSRPDVLISPHCSGVYAGWEAKSAEMFADNLARWLADQPLENIVDPKAGY